VRVWAAGGYVANESAYRNTLLRDALGLAIPAGHISTPVMSRFLTGTTVVTDSMYESYRNSIVQQGRNLVFSVARNVRAAPTPLVTQAPPVDIFLWRIRSVPARKR
jgi:hypothetical protein